MKDKTYKDRDAYFTNKDIAKKCYDKSIIELKNHITADTAWFIEPAAGGGSFFSLMPQARRLGIDIDPQCEGVIKDNFLSIEIPDKNKQWVCITNPPFGYRLELANSFFNKLCLFCDGISFITPHSFCKYNNRKKLLKTHELIYKEALPDKSFHTPNGKSYSLPSELSIWAKTNKTIKLVKPKTTHDDFEMYSYTPYGNESQRNTINNPFDIALRGSYFSSKKGIVLDIKNLNKDVEWILIKCKNNDIKERLLNIDWDNEIKGDMLKHINKSTIVKAYDNAYNSNNNTAVGELF